MNKLIAESEDINFIDNPNLDALEWSQKAIVMLRQQQAEIGCYKLELELHKAMIQDLENALRKAQEK